MSDPTTDTRPEIERQAERRAYWRDRAEKAEAELRQAEEARDNWHAAYHAEHVKLRQAEERAAKWLEWSGGHYPDESPGDVIHADTDGTIVLDDGITTWNPLRALAWFGAASTKEPHG